MKTKDSKLRFLLSGLTLITFLCVFLFSCHKEDVASINTCFDYEQIGIEHNKGLDYIFEYLKKEGVGKEGIGLKSGLNIFDLIEAATLSFTKTLDSEKDVDYNGIKLTFRHFESNTLKSASVNNLSVAIQPHVNITPLQISFLDRLDTIMSNVRIGLEFTIERIKEVEYDILTKCSEKEVELLLACTSVARHSLEYWTNNYENWLIEFGSAEVGTINALLLKSTNERDWEWFWDTLGDMGKGDVIGAGIGSIVPGAGTISCACFASAGTGIRRLLNW